MAYSHKSIRDVIKMIDENKIYLPAIQRKFVWKKEQIYCLFDSIMRGYPIGTFLFWIISGKKKNQYTFYKFLKKYHERDRYLNHIAPKPSLRKEIIGMLDGQQRLSSMYVALQGTYAFKKHYARRDDDTAYPPRKLCLNLLFDSNDTEEEETLYDFQFSTDEEAEKITTECLWFPIREVLLWEKDPDIDSYYDELLNNENLQEDCAVIIRRNRKQIKKTIRILHQRIVIEELINYYEISEPELDNILDIFVRVNSAGTVLSKSDLLFSTIVASWQEGREKIEELIKAINNKGDGFCFNTDFVMRSCLVLTDCPVLFKVKSFRSENIQVIKDNWEEIKRAIEKTVNLLVDYGFNGDNLTSQNAIIPIIYYFIKGGKNTIMARKEIRRYIIHSLLKGIYGSHGDYVLSRFREGLRKKIRNKYILKNQEFSFMELLKLELTKDKTLELHEDDIREILESKKGPYTFMVLSLLYPNLKFGQIKFHQDHIHPANFFTNRKLKKLGVPKEKWEHWQDIKDTLPNLQIMEGKENETKSNTPFKEWLKKNIKDITKYKMDNYIPPNVDLDFKYFDIFYKKRRDILERKLKKILLS